MAQELPANALMRPVLAGRPTPPPPTEISVVGLSLLSGAGLATPGSANASVRFGCAVLRSRSEGSCGRGITRSGPDLSLCTQWLQPMAHRGHKMYVRGLLIKLPSEQRMTISSFETLAPSCTN